MNQRSRNRRRNPIVLIGQLIKRRNGSRIAQHHGDLTATGNAGGLALGAGLWLGHSGSPKCVVGALRRYIADVCVIHARVMLANAADGDVARLFGMLGRNLIDDHRLPLSRAGLDGGKADAVEVHGLSHHPAHVFDAFAVRLPAGQLLGHRLATLFRGGCNCEQALFNSDPDKLAGLFTKIGSKGAAFSENLIHGLLQSGLIPPMCESYSVTSDNATTILQVAA